MATTHPNWLNTSFVQKVLQNCEKDKSIKVSRLTVTKVTSNGEYYASNMHRATVKFSRVDDGRTIHEETSLIVKSMLSDDSLFQKVVEGTGFFQTELSIMSVTLPRMNEILGKLSPTSFGARCFHVQYENPINIVFEDLAPRGYRLANRYSGLDLDHCLLAIQNIGRFHASSIALKEKDPMAFAQYTKGLLHKDQPSVAAVHFNSFAKLLANESAKWPELSPRIVGKLIKLSNLFYEKGCEAALYQENEFNVLNHGDLWINNMLFRYDERQKPIAHIFVDFQLCYYGSPALDIIHFFCSSLVDDVRHHREFLLREYHTSLTSTMAKLNCNNKALGFAELQDMLEKRIFFEVFVTVAFLTPRIIVEGEKIEHEVRNKIAECRRIMIRRLSFFDDKGLLDV